MKRTVPFSIAFPKNKKAQDAMMNAPSKVYPEQLRDVHIKLDIKEKDKEVEKESEE